MLPPDNAKSLRTRHFRENLVDPRVELATRQHPVAPGVFGRGEQRLVNVRAEGDDRAGRAS